MTTKFGVDKVQYRGFIVNLFAPRESTLLDKGSKRILSFFKGMMPRLELYLLIVYSTRASISAVVNDGKSSQSARRLYLTSTFPYIRKKVSADSYKTLFYKFRFVATGRSYSNALRFSIINAGSESDVAFLIAVDPKAQLAIAEKAGSLPKVFDEVGSTEANKIEFAANELKLKTNLNGLDAREAAFQLIKLYCSARFNHRSVYKLMKKFDYEGMKKRGDAEALRLDNTLMGVLKPYQVGRHGYKLAFKFADLKNLEREVSSLCRSIERLGAQPFINSGTLLGYVRDGGPILHDDDLDLSVIVQGESPRASAQAWHIFLNKMAEEYYIISKGAFFSLYLESGYEIDIFPAWIFESRLYVYPYCWGEVDQSQALPIKWEIYRSEALPLPRQPEKLLEVNYGPNWKIPDPYWRFDYKLSHKRFKGVLPLFRGAR